MSNTNSNAAATAAATPATNTIYSDNARFPMMVLDSEGKNYSNWASRMQSVFKVYRIWDIVQDESKGGTAMPMAQGQPLMDWLERDEKAFTYIKCYVSNPCMAMIHDKQHA